MLFHGREHNIGEHRQHLVAMETLLLSLIFLLVNRLHAAIGPSEPAADVGSACSPGTFIADNVNYCFYWQCMQKADGSFTATSKMCALGTRLSDYYISGSTNPCSTKSFNAVKEKYECHRTNPIVSESPGCAETWWCSNGQLVIEADRCWCKCSTGYTGPHCDGEISSDASVPETNAEAPCVDGKPMKDWCAQAGGCLNDGTCHNQCNDFWCSCPYQQTNTYVGKRCENYGGTDDTRVAGAAYVR